MSLDSGNARVAITGAVYAGPTSAAAPTSTSSTLTGFDDLGYTSEDGITENINRTTDAKKAWQNAATIREDVTDADFTIAVTLIETKAEVVALYFGADVVDGVVDITPGVLGPRKSFVTDYIDGDKIERTYIADGQVTEVNERQASNGDFLGYGVTIKGYASDALGGASARKFYSVLGAS